LARLLYSDRSGRQQALQLDLSRTQVVVGRQADCEIIVHDTSVSRRHCVIAPEEGGFVVVDLGSANGTLVNNVRITRRRLVDNDVIRCGIYAVRFVEASDAVEPAQMNLRDRYRQRSENAGRAAVERLQALNANHVQRLVQLQDELARLDGERHAALERSARQERELLAAREQLHEMQAHLRHLAAALHHREAELATLRGDGAGHSSAPPIPPPPVSGGGMADAALASTNHALRVEIAQLESALAAEDAFVRASAIVPAIDRWRAVEMHQRAAREAQATVERRQGALEASQARSAGVSAAPSPDIAAETAGRIADLEDKARAAERSRRDAERARRDAETRAAAAEAKAKAAVRRAGPLAGRIDGAGSGVSRASVFGQVASTKTGFLSGLGGLGRTAADARTQQPAAEPLGDRLKSLGRQTELNRQTEDRDLKSARSREIEAVVERLIRGRNAARESASVLVEQLEAFRDTHGVSGISALQVAECLDLAGSIRAALQEEEPG